MPGPVRSAHTRRRLSDRRTRCRQRQDARDRAHAIQRAACGMNRPGNLAAAPGNRHNCPICVHIISGARGQRPRSTGRPRLTRQSIGPRHSHRPRQTPCSLAELFAPCSRRAVLRTPSAGLRAIPKQRFDLCPHLHELVAVTRCVVRFNRLVERLKNTRLAVAHTVHRPCVDIVKERPQ